MDPERCCRAGGGPSLCPDAERGWSSGRFVTLPPPPMRWASISAFRSSTEGLRRRLDLGGLSEAEVLDVVETADALESLRPRPSEFRFSFTDLRGAPQRVDERTEARTVQRGCNETRVATNKKRKEQRKHRNKENRLRAIGKRGKEMRRGSGTDLSELIELSPLFIARLSRSHCSRSKIWSTILIGAFRSWQSAIADSTKSRVEESRQCPSSSSSRDPSVIRGNLLHSTRVKNQRNKLKEITAAKENNHTHTERGRRSLGMATKGNTDADKGADL